MSHRAPPPKTREEAAEFHGDDVPLQECPRCGTYHSGYSPPICFACAVGLKRRSS